jgi:hypothetical protein
MKKIDLTHPDTRNTIGITLLLGAIVLFFGMQLYGMYLAYSFVGSTSIDASGATEAAAKDLAFKQLDYAKLVLNSSYYICAALIALGVALVITARKRK